MAVRVHRRSLLELVDRLESVAEPVTPAGVLHVHDLITDGRSLLYGPEGIDSLGETFERPIRLLDPAASRQARLRGR